MPGVLFLAPLEVTAVHYNACKLKTSSANRDLASKQAGGEYWVLVSFAMQVEEIMAALLADGGDFCKKAHDTIMTMSPTSCKVTLRQVGGLRHTFWNNVCFFT